MNEPNQMPRREAIKWMLAAAGTMAAMETGSFAATPGTAGYGTDPNLLEVYKPGDLWPLTFDRDQRDTVIALCDVIIPADEKSPSASQVRRSLSTGLSLMGILSEVGGGSRNAVDKNLGSTRHSSGASRPHRRIGTKVPCDRR